MRTSSKMACCQSTCATLGCAAWRGRSGGCPGLVLGLLQNARGTRSWQSVMFVTALWSFSCCVSTVCCTTCHAAAEPNECNAYRCLGCPAVHDMRSPSSPDPAGQAPHCAAVVASAFTACQAAPPARGAGEISSMSPSFTQRRRTSRFSKCRA